jgi:hypothetical protein
MRGLSPKIISVDSQRSENAQTHTYKHTIPYMKFKLKLLQIKCHVLEFTKDEAQNMLQKIIRVFVEAFISQGMHTLFALDLPLTALVGLDLPLIALVGVVGRSSHAHKKLKTTRVKA